MEQTIKMEVKIEKAEPRDENDPTPLRERVEESSPRACAFEPDTSVSICGWDSDLEEIELPPTPGASLQALIPKDEFKMGAMLDEMLNDFATPPPPPSPPTVLPPPPPPPSPPTVLPPLNPVLDGLPSAYTARENLEEMDLCSLGDEESHASLVAERVDILRKLAIVNEEGIGEQKKKKKSKKRKRSHRSSKEKEKETESKKRSRSSTSPDESRKDNTRSQRPHWPSHGVKPEEPDLDCVPVRAEEKRLRVVKASNLFESQTPKLVPKKENLSIKDKRQRGVARAQLALQLFQQQANKDADALMVDTMCKLPVHDSFRNQNVFENPSPLCNNKNVAYEFNTVPGTRIDLAKWGLEVLPQPIRVLCRILGLDIHRLKVLQRTATPSQRILRMKQELIEQGVSAEDGDKATLYKTAWTQTDRKTSTHEMGIQARMEGPPKGCAFWQKPAFNATEMTQQQSNVMYALQELTKMIPNAAVAETLYRRLGPALAIARQSN